MKFTCDFHRIGLFRKGSYRGDVKSSGGFVFFVACCMIESKLCKKTLFCIFGRSDGLERTGMKLTMSMLISNPAQAQKQSL